VPGRRDDASVEVRDAVLTFTDAMDRAGHCERRAFLGARSSNDAARRETGRDPEVERVAAEAQLAAGTIEAIRDAREGNMERAQLRLDEALAEARRHASVQGQRLERQQRNVSGLRAALAAVRPAPMRTPTGAPSAAPPRAHARRRRRRRSKSSALSWRALERTRVHRAGARRRAASAASPRRKRAAGTAARRSVRSTAHGEGPISE
jgi:hypothetical protein